MDMRICILLIRVAMAARTSAVGASGCPLAYGQHRYIYVEQRCNDAKTHYYMCKGCGDEKPLEHACVVQVDHDHDYRNYCGCIGGFYVLRCTYFGCDSILRIFNKDSQTCINTGKHKLPAEDAEYERGGDDPEQDIFETQCKLFDNEHYIDA
jgi:hypothetical protein